MSGRLGRRAFAVGVAASAGLAALEASSLAGAFDHRRQGVPTAQRELAALLREVAGDGVVHIGHSTHLLVVGGRRLLTDPWFSDPAFGALSHARGPAWRSEELGALDAILVSHEHPDHADLDALERVANKSAVEVFVPTDTLRARLRARGLTSVQVLSPGEHASLGGVSVTAVPALHDVPEIGFVVEGPAARVYFAGDTALHPAFAAIAERFRPMLAILPIDGTRLRGSAFGSMGPAEAVVATRLLAAPAVMASHAEAIFTDPFAERVLAATVPDVRASFRRRMAVELPGVRCALPGQGEWVPIFPGPAG